MNTHDIGDTARLVMTFTVAGVLTDPATLTFSIVAPDGTLTTYVYGTDAEVVRASVGVFRVDWPVALAGVHVWRAASTGAAVGAEEGIFNVRQSWVL